MDAAWLATLADKDYVFATDWAPVPGCNVAYPLVIAATFLMRSPRPGPPGRSRTVAGCPALAAAFAEPAAGRDAPCVAVQLQVSRVFWMTDLLAMLGASCGGRVPEADARAALAAPRTAARSRWAFAALAALALGAGLVRHVRRASRSTSVRPAAPTDAWSDASAWLRRLMPPDSQVLANPGHAWRYGLSLRVLAIRDVFLENVKDGATGTYHRRRPGIAERRLALDGFDQLTAPTLAGAGATV